MSSKEALEAIKDLFDKRADHVIPDDYSLVCAISEVIDEWRWG